MKEYFTQQNLNKLEEELKSWLGTPYRRNTAVKGRGADCSLFLAAVLHKLEIITGFDRPKYLPRNWYFSSGGREIFLENFEKNKKYLAQGLEANEVNDLRPGDWMMMKTGKSLYINHSGIYISESKVYQALEKSGVVCVPLQRWRKYIVKIYRLFEV